MLKLEYKVINTGKNLSENTVLQTDTGNLV